MTILIDADACPVVEIAIAPAVPFEFVLLRLGRSDQAFELAEQGFARARLAGAA